MDGKRLMRRREAMDRLGVSWWGFRQLIESGALPPVRVVPHARAYYRTDDVERLACGVAGGNVMDGMGHEGAG